MLSLLLFAALAAGPQPGPIKAFGDWVVACDNLHGCEMTSLTPGEGTESAGEEYDAVALSIARAAGPAGAFDVEIQFSVPKVAAATVQVDGAVVARGAVRNDLLRIGGADAAKVVAAIVKGKALAVADASGKTIGRVSLAGSSAALRFIDADQGRAGTVSAAVAKGAKPASAVPVPGSPPSIAHIRPAGAPAGVNAALIRAMGKASECDSEFTDGLPKVETYALGGGKTLALLPCGAGAYNYLSVPFLIGAGKPVIAQFDFAPGMTEADSTMPMLVNADWDAKNGTLSSYSKGRGLGDCGSAEDYVWDGSRFRLIGARQMIECRGSVNWLTVWRATAVAR